MELRSKVDVGVPWRLCINVAASLQLPDGRLIIPGKQALYIGEEPFMTLGSRQFCIFATGTNASCYTAQTKRRHPRQYSVLPAYALRNLRTLVFKGCALDTDPAYYRPLVGIPKLNAAQLRCIAEWPKENPSSSDAWRFQRIAQRYKYPPSSVVVPQTLSVLYSR